MVDILAIRPTLNSPDAILKRHFLCGHGPNFGRPIKNLGLFLSRAWVDGVLRWRANDDVEGTYHPMHHRQIFDKDDTLEEYKKMGAVYVQAIVDSLNKRYPNLLVFNASMFF